MPMADSSRRMTVLLGEGSTFFGARNHGVKSVTLDLKIPESRAIPRKLAAPSLSQQSSFGGSD
jgi:crotonobetainyl-CoA:carnitine CoA-transferase CaiB-like acyl-CoA transferase